MRVQVYLCVYQCTCKLLNTVRGAALRQFVGDILGVVICQVHHSFTKRMGQAAFLHIHTETIDHAVAAVNPPGLRPLRVPAVTAYAARIPVIQPAIQYPVAG